MHICTIYNLLSSTTPTLPYQLLLTKVCHPSYSKDNQTLTLSLAPVHKEASDRITQTKEGPVLSHNFSNYCPQINYCVTAFLPGQRAFLSVWVAEGEGRASANTAACHLPIGRIIRCVSRGRDTATTASRLPTKQRATVSRGRGRGSCDSDSASHAKKHNSHLQHGWPSASVGNSDGRM